MSCSLKHDTGVSPDCPLSRLKLAEAVRAWAVITPQSVGSRDFTTSKETARRHALEDRDKTLSVVQDLERKLQIAARWTAASPQWAATAEMVAKRGYRCCVDNLEGLVVSRMFKEERDEEEDEEEDDREVSELIHKLSMASAGPLPGGWRANWQCGSLVNFLG